MFTNSARSLASKFPHIGRARRRRRRRHRLIMRFTLLRTKSSSVDELMWPSWSSGPSGPRERASEGLWLRKVGQQVLVSSVTLCINIYAYSGHTINADADANAYALGQSFVGASQGSKGVCLLTLQHLYSQLPPSPLFFFSQHAEDPSPLCDVAYTGSRTSSLLSKSSMWPNLRPVLDWAQRVSWPCCLPNPTRRE